MFRTLIATLPVIALVACEPIEEPPVTERPPVSIEGGAWLMELSNPSLDGACMGMDPREIEDAVMGAWITMPDSGHVRIDLDAFVLEGTVEGRSLAAEGFLSTEPDEPEPMPGDDEPVYDGDEPRPGEEPPGPAEDEDCEPEPAGGIRIRVAAEIDSATLFFGQLELGIVGGGMDCAVTADFSAEYLGECWDAAEPPPGDEPVAVEEAAGGAGARRDCGDGGEPLREGRAVSVAGLSLRQSW